MSRIRVLEMIDQPSLGGGPKAVLLLAASLDPSNFDVSVCSEPGGPLVKELRSLGVRHHPASFGKKHWRRNISQIRRILKDESVDILHTHGGVAGFFGRWAARKNKVPVIIHTLHGIHYLHYRNPLQRRLYIHLEKIFSRFTDKLIFVSGADGKQAKRFRLAPDPKMAIIKNGVDLRGLPTARDSGRIRSELGLAGNGPLVGTVSRLHRQKGVVYLIRAAAQIREAFPGVKVVCAGGGPLRSKMEDEIRKLGLQGTVILLGETPEAVRLISALDVFILPSLWEGLPFVLIEAAALGKPIVATDAEGNREIITSGETGILVPARKPAALAEAVIGLLHDKGLAGRLAASAQKRVPSRFALSRMIRETEDLYLAAWHHRRFS